MAKVEITDIAVQFFLEESEKEEEEAANLVSVKKKMSHFTIFLLCSLLEADSYLNARQFFTSTLCCEHVRAATNILAGERGCV